MSVCKYILYLAGIFVEKFSGGEGNSGWLRQPRTIIADSGLSGAGPDWNVHYVIYLTAHANLDDVIVALIQWKSS